MEHSEILDTIQDSRSSRLADDQQDRVRDIIDVWKDPLSESEKGASLADAVSFEALDSDTKQLIYEYLQIAELSPGVGRVNLLGKLLEGESFSIATKQSELAREKALQDQADPDNKSRFDMRMIKCKDAYSRGYIDGYDAKLKVRQIELEHYPQYYNNTFALDHLREQIDDELSELKNKNR